MQFKLPKNEFLQALSDVQGVVERKNVMPVLANVLLEADGAYLKISATDLEIASVATTIADVKESGKITVPARKLFDIVKEAAGEDVQIKLTANDRLEITSKQTQCRIVALSANEFPKLPEPEGEFTAISAEKFSKLISKVVPAMSTDETRYHLNGVFLEQSGNDLVIVATDGHRLALTRDEIKLPGLKAEGVIVPRKGVNELRKLVSGQKAFQVSVSPRSLFVRTETRSLFIRLLDGEFPKYSRVIPESVATEIAVNRQSLLGALRRVSLLSDEYSRGVKLYFCNNSLTVNTVNHDVGEAKEELEVNFAGEPFEVSFNASYLKDAVDVLDDDTIVMGFNQSTTPCVVKSPSEPGYCAVVMPIRM